MEPDATRSQSRCTQWWVRRSASATRCSRTGRRCRLRSGRPRARGRRPRGRGRWAAPAAADSARAGSAALRQSSGRRCRTRAPAAPSAGSPIGIGSTRAPRSSCSARWARGAGRRGPSATGNALACTLEADLTTFLKSKIDKNSRFVDLC